MFKGAFTMSYYTDKIECIRKELENKSSVPTYEPQKWKALFGKPIYTNCYAYALDLIIPDPKEEIFIPGCISDSSTEKVLWTYVTGHVKKDLDFLGIQYREDDSSALKPGEYRIALYYIPTFHDMPLPFHMARQDENGEWSEKIGWKGKVQKIGLNGDNPPVYPDTNHGPFGPKLDSVLILKRY